MELRLTVQNIPEIEYRLKAIPGGASKALSMAINRALFSGRTQAVRLVREKYNVKYNYALHREKVYISSPGHMFGYINAESQATPLRFFTGLKISRTGGGVDYEMEKGQTVHLANAFGLKWKFGAPRVMEREGDSRLPLVEIKGPAIPTMEEEVLPQIEAYIQGILNNRLEHEITRMLEKAAKE